MIYSYNLVSYLNSFTLEHHTESEYPLSEFRDVYVQFVWIVSRRRLCSTLGINLFRKSPANSYENFNLFAAPSDPDRAKSDKILHISVKNLSS